MIRSDFLKKYSVSIRYKYNGSGVLVKVNENHCYLLTAKHNFKMDSNERHNNIITKDIDLNKILVKTDNDEIAIIKEVVYEYDDLIIFLVDDKNIEDLDLVQVLKGKPTNDMDYFLYGYPTHEPNGHLVDKLRSRTDIDRFRFKLRNIDNNKTSYLEGLSGSGLFTEDKRNVNYLCGIVLQSKDKYFEINSINLSTIINKINETLIEQKLSPILIKENDFYLKNITDTYSIIKSFHSDNFLVKKLELIFKKEHSYEDLIQPSQKLERLNKYMESTNQFELLENIYTQKLADMYLLGAFVANKYHDKEEALRYFQKARYFRPEYTLFLTELDKENSKEELLQCGKIAYVDERYGYANDCFLKVLSLKLEKFEKIIVYEYLVNISKKIKNKNIRKEYYYELLKLYEKDIQKVEVNYELSLLSDRKEEKMFYIKQALKFIDIYDDSFIEFKYLVYKRIFELEENKDNYLLLYDSLEKLVTVKPKYKYELSTLNYAFTLDMIAWGVYFLLIGILYLSLFIYQLNTLNLLEYKIQVDISIFLLSLFFEIKYQIKGILLMLNRALIVLSIATFIFILS